MIDYLITIYSEIKEENIVRLLKEFKYDLIDYFKEHSIEPILEEFKKYSNNIPFSVLVQDPSGLLQITLLTNAINLRLAENHSLERISVIKYAFQNSLSNQVSVIIDKSKPQLIALGIFLKRVADICIGMGVPDIYILELPIGNSIPSALLKKILISKGKESHFVSLSINRNDSKSKGITRKELLKTKINDLDLDNSLMIYLDEWISGSNFSNIITILSKIPNLKFFPGAFLTHESKSNERYSQYKSKFDTICKSLGLEHEEFLVELPSLNHTIVTDQRFIWTEIDRMAGYRKLEFLGSIISTFFAVGEALLEDSNKLNTTLEEAIIEYTDLGSGVVITQEIKESILKSFEYFNSTFVIDLEERINSIELILNAPFDFESEIAKVLELFKTTKGYTDSQLAINIIGYHMKNKIISPSSRYFFKGHVPLCLPLEGDEKYISDLFIGEIEKLILK